MKLTNYLRTAFTVCVFAVLAQGCLLPDSRTEAKGNVRAYKSMLEARLLEQYNNLPKWAGKISRVELILPHPPERSVSGNEMRVEYDQLVYDIWGKRVPSLEEEYFMVTFGNGQPRLVSTDPSITVGLNIEGGFSESMSDDSGYVEGVRHEDNIRRIPVNETPEIESDPTGMAMAGLATVPALTSVEGESAPERREVQEVSGVDPVNMPEMMIETDDGGVLSISQNTAPAKQSTPAVAKKSDGNDVNVQDGEAVAAVPSVPAVPDMPAPVLIRTMAPPKSINGRLPRSEIRNLESYKRSSGE